MEIGRWAVRERDPKVVISFAGKDQGIECKCVHCRWVGGLRGRFKTRGNYPPTPLLAQHFALSERLVLTLIRIS